jgi:hypothetical protein
MRKMLRISVYEEVEVKGGWRKLHNYELHNSNSSPIIIRAIKKDEMAGHVARM